MVSWSLEWVLARSAAPPVVFWPAGGIFRTVFLVHVLLLLLAPAPAPVLQAAAGPDRVSLQDLIRQRHSGSAFTLLHLRHDDDDDLYDKLLLLLTRV